MTKLLREVCFYVQGILKKGGNVNSKPGLLNLILLNLIVRLPTERSHYTNNLWNATFGL